MPASSLICEINAQTGELKIDQTSFSLRPKSFELLLLLAQHPEQVFSKQQILTSVWGTSVVDEQVIFQSINEIRKVTGHAEIIKTYPRRGYCWNISSTKILQQQPLAAEPKTRRRYTTYFSIVLVALLLTYIAVSHNSQNRSPTSHLQSDHSQEKQHKGILVLPFNVSELSGAQQWLRFGAMQGLIDTIAPNSSTTVFHLEDVIDILNRLPLNQRNNIEQIFAVSGASHILQTAISGQPGELHIIYNIYTPDSHHTRVLDVSNIDSALPELTREFEAFTGAAGKVSSQGVSQQLQNQLIAKAIQFLETEDYNSALAFIQSAVANDGNNLAAWYFLAKIQLQMNNAREALQATKQALALKTAPNLLQYQPRLHYLHAIALLQQGKTAQAETSLLLAEQQAKTNKDWLYYAYSQSILGKIRQGQKQLDAAYQRFNAALQYQELLNCPMGIAQAHLDLSEFYLNKRNRQQAIKSFEIAEQLITEKQLSKAISILEHTRKLL